MIETVLYWLPRMLEGLALTLELLFFSAIIALILAFPIGLSASSSKFKIRLFSKIYIFFFRGTPFILQLALVYYGLAQFEFVRQSVFWPYLRDPYWCALITMSLHSAAYVGEILRGAIQSLPVGEVEAARALGLSKTQTLFSVISPRSIRIGLPAYINEVILMLKTSAVVYTITLYDLMGAAKTIASRTYEFLLFFSYAGFLYLCVTIVLTCFFRFFEKKYLSTP